MKIDLVGNVVFGIAFSILSACTVDWTKSIQYGYVSKEDFRDTVKMQIKEGLIFVPVTIKGEEYQFLFDTGAPLSISEQLQKKYSYRLVSKGNIVDSDRNKKKVDWVQLDSIQIGEVTFVNHTAFVGDFTANPILECLGFDGIIGSNLIRQCNWTIDQEDIKLVLSSSIDSSTLAKSSTVSFTADNQYDMFANINIGTTTIKNLLIDYGSNGPITVNNEIFDELMERKIFGEVLLEKGIQQSGIVGKPIKFDRQFTRLDSMGIRDQLLYDVELRTGKKDLIGNEVLSRFLVTIDWTSNKLHLMTKKPKNDEKEPFGFTVGYTEAKGVYVQSVIENSDADEMGVRPNMLVAKLDSLDFENGNDFCDYMELEVEDSISLELIDLNGKRQTYQIERAKLSK